MKLWKQAKGVIASALALGQRAYETSDEIAGAAFRELLQVGSDLHAMVGAKRAELEVHHGPSVEPADLRSERMREFLASMPQMKCDPRPAFTVEEHSFCLTDWGAVIAAC